MALAFWRARDLTALAARRVPALARFARNINFIKSPCVHTQASARRLGLNERDGRHDKGSGLPSHTYSEFANGTPRCMAAEHASKRFSSAGSPSTCEAWTLKAVESAASVRPHVGTAAPRLGP